MLPTRILRNNNNIIITRVRTAAMSTTLQKPVPIALIGIHTSIGSAVAEGLRPDWDVVCFIQSFRDAQSQLPHLLRGSPLPESPSNNDVGSGDLTHGPVRAVLFGRGFSQQEAQTLYASLGAEGGGSAPPVVWVAGDEARRPAGFDPPAGIERVMIPIFRDALEKWEAEGASETKIVLY
ncbi:hypothetical protein F4802DRAFT_418451 [Xylaria palmicola]|nr:hypothetical protein F4802DRAFT_418451 [Xylaria palmicola]